MEAAENINNEAIIQNNMIKMDNVYNVCKATIKLDLNDGVGSGFFIKLERNNKEFYCIMTNEHVITEEHINNKEEILINYDNEKKYLIIKLDKKERIIEYFKESLGLDIAIVEIIPKDNIDNSFFLTPNYNYNETYEKFINKDIEIVQYPKGNNLSLSQGKILKIFESNDYIFFHDAVTENGSSGSPIVLKGEEKVIALHKGTLKDEAKNVGIFIGIIVDIMKTYKINGIRREYYKNGNLKYEGNYLEDEYDGDGELHYKNGKIYIGQFKNGKKNGDGFIFKDNKVIKKGKFANDEFLGNQNAEGNNNKEHEKINNNSDKIGQSKINSNSVNDMNNNDLYKGKKEKKENYVNVDNAKNISNNNVNNINDQNNNNNFFRDFKIQSYNVFKGLGDFLGVICKRCMHQTKDHITIGYGQWKCNKCPEDDNICQIS